MMISPTKSVKMLEALKDYKRRYISRKIGDIDESSTRIMINTFLTSILGYQELEEIKTEFIIKSMYADYIVQTGTKKHFLVEVKAFSLELSDKHLRQAINYSANEGIDWAILTNGRQFQFYRVLYKKPISERLVFEIDFFSETFNLKEAQEQLSYFYKDAVIKSSLACLWSRYIALEPIRIANMLLSPTVTEFLRKELKTKYETRFEDNDIRDAIANVICTKIPQEKLKIPKIKPAPKKKSGMKLIVNKPAKIILKNNEAVQTAA